jgi:hypothetical protein
VVEHLVVHAAEASTALLDAMEVGQALGENGIP